MSSLPGTTGRRRIYLMRHGFVDYTSKEVREARDPTIAYLTDEGRIEAAAAGEALSSIHLDIAICSGLRRTIETAEIVLSSHDNPPTLEEDARLGEVKSGQYIDFKSAGELAATMTFHFERAGDPGATFLEGGEKFTDAMARIEEGILDLMARPDWHTALIVAHEVTNRLILSWSIGAPLGASASFEQDTGCINIIDFDLVPDETSRISQIERALVKSVNLTPSNYLKNGMNLRSLEAIFTRADKSS